MRNALEIEQPLTQDPQSDADAGHFKLTRRSFFGVLGAGGVSVLFHDLALANPIGLHLPGALPRPLSSPANFAAAPGWSGAPGKARYRIEGMAKVTGQKIYARDFRARDMLGWPVSERMAMIIRATDATRLFLGIDLSMLPPELKPLRTIMQSDLAALNLTLPFSSAGPKGTPSELLVAAGTQPVFYGQPVAMLIFADWPTYRRAKRVLQFNPQVITYGATTPPPVVPPPPYQPVNYLTRYDVAGTPPFSQVQVGYESDPFKPDSPSQPYNSKARESRVAIDKSVNAPTYQRVAGTYNTQVLDPMFMEPEAGLAWLDKTGTGTLNLVLGTQATNGDMADTLGLFGSKTCPIKVANVSLHSCYPGGGFGGRDVSTFPPLLAVASAFADGPVRIAQDRYEQFQGGLKQLSSSINHTLAFDAAGKFIAFKSQQVLGAGGNNNYSQFIAMLAAYCGLSGYNIKQAYVDAVALPSKGVVAGSMRGFGGPQASFAVETLVDEAAVMLGKDPIAVRLANVLTTGDRTITGAPLTQAMTLDVICKRAMSHPLWTQRATVKQQKAAQGIMYGVGFALANQAYGTGTDGVMAEVSIGPDGLLTVRTNCVDMGNGSATSLAISTAAYAGNNAAQIEMGDAGYFNALQMVSGYDVPNPNWTNPAWTASFSMSSSACLTAFHQVHVTEQATRVLFQTGILPAAAAIWNVPASRIADKCTWKNGMLYGPSLPGLSIAQIAQRLHQMQLPAGAMVHGLYQGRWVSATYTVGANSQVWPIDGLSLRNAGSTSWQPIWRTNVVPPDPASKLYGRSLYAPSGVLIAVEIPVATLQPKVVAVELIVDAGRVVQPDLLMGQAQGGIAMGIGYALLENLPLEAGGAGDGRWNLDRYHVALAADLPLNAMHITTLPATENTGKGIAEAVLCPIAPAVGNAIAYATGKRFRSLPITAADIRKAMK